LALGIYGLVLFPSAEGMIDFEVVNVFKNVVTLKINLATAILAETFSSLNYCRKARMGRLRCCLQLLFVWTMSQMSEGKISGLVGTPWHLYSQLENFAEKHLHEVGRTTWESMFLTLPPFKCAFEPSTPFECAFEPSTPFECAFEPSPPFWVRF
jgi:hypothetical protein